MHILETAFAIFCFLLIYPFILYPLVVYGVYVFADIRTRKPIKTEGYCPDVSIIIAVYNEAKVIAQKLQTIFDSLYEHGKVIIYIGSDGSNDGSVQIIQEIESRRSDIRFFSFAERRGKTSIINDLCEAALRERPASRDHVFVFTDANVFLEPNAIAELVAPLSDARVALVDSKIIQRSQRLEGIAESERAYMGFESRLKFMEGQLWGYAMGAFGGCYALRTSFYQPLPQGLLVDDFFLSMQAMLAGGRCIVNPEALCYEDIPTKISEEFRRKRRIASGNFQNLRKLLTSLRRMPTGLLFVFVSHKVLRWLLPLNLILFFLCTVMLSPTGAPFYHAILWMLLVVLIGLPVFDGLLERFGLRIPLLRSWKYFVAMNCAVLLGFWGYLRGIRQSSWLPPDRTA
ncbi:MAG: glycosyltransferase [Saprospiraceae bacterium]|nr:glycosyltransferase [Saprospiraceae bacterium]